MDFALKILSLRGVFVVFVLVVVLSLILCARTVAQDKVCALFISQSLPCFMRALSDDLSFYLTFLLLRIFSFLHFLLLFTFLEVSRQQQPCALPQRSLGPRTHSILLQVMSPNDYFLTETYVEFNQESVTEQRFPEDLDHDDSTIGQTLFNAYRRRVDYSEGEDLSSSLSSSSMSHHGTGKPVVGRDTSYEPVTKFQRQNSENEQIRTLLDRQREQILAGCQAEI